jgi:hypothetical protein
MGDDTRCYTEFTYNIILCASPLRILDKMKTNEKFMLLMFILGLFISAFAPSPINKFSAVMVGVSFYLFIWGNDEFRKREERKNLRY